MENHDKYMTNLGQKCVLPICLNDGFTMGN